MSYIFMDESGCLGFDWHRDKTSKNFLITFVFVDNKRVTDRIVKNVFKSMPSKYRRKHRGALHCNKEQPRTRMKLFNELRHRDDVSVMCIRLDKQKVFTRLQEEKAVFYNYVTNVLLDRILTRKLVPHDRSIHLIASRRETNKFLNRNFEQYIINETIIKHPVNISVEIRTPHQEKGLQVVDAASWALFRKYEHQDSAYYNIFKELVVEEYTLFE